MTEIIKAQKIILMKSGLIFWINSDTAEKISRHLSNQTAHSFITITELNNKSLNSAEIEGVYGQEEYDDIQKLKQRMYKCSFNKWHKKNEECICAEEIKRQKKIEEQEKENREMQRELTPFERDKQRDSMRRSVELWALKGNELNRKILLEKNWKVRRSSIIEFEKDGSEANLLGLEIEEDLI